MTVLPPAARPRPARSLDGRRVLLVVGCGDVGLRVLRRALPRWRVLALTSSPARAPLLRAAGAVPRLGDLDDRRSLARLAGLADAVLHLAPPPGQGHADPRTAHLLAALARGRRPAVWVYGSTTGVYGDAQGAFFDETRPVAPRTDRGRRRVDAEARLRAGTRRPGTRCALLRIPGIYAADRDGGDPRDRVRRGSPVLCPEDDVFTNHIHADDLAAACLAALWRAPAGGRAFHVCDATQRRMGDHFDAVADASGLARPPRIGRAQAQATLSPMQLSFLSESRRLDNRRLHEELRVRLAFPDVLDALAQGR